MGVIFWMVISRPPCSWVSDSRMSLAGTMNSGFGGSGGGGVPSGISPRIRAVFAGGAEFSDDWVDADVAAASMTRKAVVNGFMGKVGLVSFLVDGEFKSRLQTTALAFSLPRRVGLDMRHRLPGRLVGLAASLRSMPTAVSEILKSPSI